MNAPSMRAALPPRGAIVLLGGLGALLTAYATIAVGSVGPPGLQDALGRWGYDAVLLGAAAAVLVRAAMRRVEQGAWLCLGSAILLWALGQTYYSVALYYAYPAPTPSLADAFFLSFYPPTYVALVLMLRTRLARDDRLAWMDALIAALAVAAVAAALVVPPTLEALGGGTLGVAVNVAYPCADLVLLGLAAGAITTSGWRGQSTWLLIAAALAIFAISDVVYLSVDGQATEALDIASIGWPLAFLLLAWAAWLPGAAAELLPERTTGWLGLPIGLATAVICLLALGSFVPVNPVAVGLGVASLLVVLARLAATFSLNARLLASSQDEASTDWLTGLPNRRSLMADLNDAVALPPDRAKLFVLFDLDGFKAYNDRFGHTMGDELLKRLAARLASVPWGKAYRLGGDEFCILASIADADDDAIVAAGQAALLERGPGFSIEASWGTVRISAEAATARDALRLADRRMYAAKGSRASDEATRPTGEGPGLSPSARRR